MEEILQTYQLIAKITTGLKQFNRLYGKEEF